MIVAAALGIVNPDAWRGLARTSRVEVAIAAVTMAGVIAVGVLEALLVAVALSIIDVVRRSAIPHDAVLGWDERMGRYADVSVHRGPITPGVLVYRLDDRLFFANAGYVSGRIREAVTASPRCAGWCSTPRPSPMSTTGARALIDLIRSLRDERDYLRVRARHDPDTPQPGGGQHRRAGRPRSPLPHRARRRPGGAQRPRGAAMSSIPPYVDGSRKGSPGTQARRRPALDRRRGHGGRGRAGGGRRRAHRPRPVRRPGPGPHQRGPRRRQHGQLAGLAALAALLATGLLHLLLLTTPRPGRFFSWIIGLATVIAAILPFMTDAQPSTQVATADQPGHRGDHRALLSGVARSAMRTRQGPDATSPDRLTFTLCG